MKNSIITLLFLFGACNLWAHTIKMTTSKLSIDSQKKTCSITINFFIDDFERELINMYPQSPFEYKNPSNQMKKTIEDYILSNVIIKLNETQVSLELKSIKKIEDNICQVVLNGQLNAIQNFDVITIKNTLLFSSFDKQSNILHLYVDGEKKRVFRFFAGVPIKTERI